MNFEKHAHSPEPTMRSLSPERRALVRIFQKIRFGRIPALVVRAAEPDCGAGVRAVRMVRVLGENGPHQMMSADDFALRREVREFFVRLDELRNATLVDVEVRDGMPISFEVEERFSA
jgi:hypothetical protein